MEVTVKHVPLTDMESPKESCEIDSGALIVKIPELSFRSMSVTIPTSVTNPVNIYLPITL
jgi:hypothetical protein